MKPTPQQQAAIDSDATDILLGAGAGSGKTSTTVSRYERLLTGEYQDGRRGEPVEPAAILVFTFTDKAAGELRERIRGLRDKRSFDFSMGSLWVGTFHSICARILRSHPVAAAVDPAFDVIDDVVANRLKEAAYATALDKTCESGEAIEVLSPFSAYTLKDGIQAAYSRLRAAGELEPTLPDPSPGMSLEAIQLDLLREAELVVSDQDIPRAQRTKAGNVTTALRDLDPGDLTLEVLESIDMFKSSKHIPELCAKLAKAKTALLSREIGPPCFAVMAKLLAEYRDAYEAAKTRRGGLDFEDLQLKTLDLLLRQPEIAETYREQFTEIMVDEFQDTNRLQMDLIDLLRGEKTRLFTVGDEMQAIYGFRYADVELFRQRRSGLAYRLPADRDRREAGERDEVRFPVEHLSLTANFRSEAPVIGAVNEIGRQFEELIGGLRTDGEPGGVTGGTRHEFEDLRVGLIPEPGIPDGPRSGRSRVEILLTEAGTWQQTDFGPLAPAPGPGQHTPAGRGQHEAEALALAWHIRGAVEEGVPPGDIVILLRTKKRMWLFEAALKQVGLNPYVVGGTGFWETREGVDLRALLATLANPLDDEALAGTLAGPACGLSPGALWLLAQGRGDKPRWSRVEELAGSGIEGIDPEDRELAAGFVRRAGSLRTRQPGLSLTEFVKAAVAETGYDLVNLMRDPSGSGLANIRRVAEIAGEFEAAEGRDLRGLVKWIDDSSRLDSEQAIASEDEQADVIRLMTIHKSKGLEFPMVCVADLGRPSKSDSEKVLWIAPRIDRPGSFRVGLRVPAPEGSTFDLYDWSELKADARSETTDEELRILHVALTRAKQRLVLSGVTDLEEVPRVTESGSAATRLTQAFGIDSLEEGIQVPAPEAPEGSEFGFPPGLIDVTLVRAEDAEGIGNQVANPAMSQEDAVDGRPPIGRPPLEAFPEVPLSYSALAAYRDCPARFFASRILKLHPGQGSSDFGSEDELDDLNLDPEMVKRNRVDATAFGVAVHELLEAMPGQRWRVPAETRIREVLASHGETGEAEIDLATRMLADFAASKLGLEIRRHRVDIETGLLVEIDGIMVRGFADLLVRRPDRYLILDYKSNQLEGTTPGELMAKYDLQRDLYAVAVSTAMNVSEVETAFVFLRDPANPVRDVFDAARLERARTSISELVGEIARGRYLGGPDAGYQPCGDCWACELLAGRINAAGSLESVS